MKKKLREKAIFLRKEKRMSYGAIKDKLGVPKSTLSYWLKDYPLSKREIETLRRRGWSKGEVSREKYRETMRMKKRVLEQEVYKEEKKEMKEISQESLYIAGLMLYLGEGAKHRDSSLVLANSDPRLIKFFMKWLTTFLNISVSDMRIQLHLYENMNIEEEKRFWSKYLEMPQKNFYKVSVRKLAKGSFSYKHSHSHGTCSLYAFGVANVRKVMMAIKALLDTQNL